MAMQILTENNGRHIADRIHADLDAEYVQILHLNLCGNPLCEHNISFIFHVQ